jgi:hypothetical protein
MVHKEAAKMSDRRILQPAIRVQEQEHFPAGHRSTPILLDAPAARRLDDVRSQGSGQGGRTVGTARVNHHDLIGALRADAAKRLGNRLRLVQRGNDD